MNRYTFKLKMTTLTLWNDTSYRIRERTTAIITELTDSKSSEVQRVQKNLMYE